MYNYPLNFDMHAHATAGSQVSWKTSAHGDPNQELSMAIPPEFKGPGGALSPEDLFGLSILNCFIATFKVVAEASNFTFESVDTKITISIDKDEAGKPCVARAHMTAHLTGASAPDKAERLMQKASQACLIMNSVKTEKTFEFTLA